MYVNPHLFFLLQEEGYAVWDYKNHQQFVLEEIYLSRLLHHYKNPTLLAQTEEDKELEEAFLLSSHPFPDTPWGWDALSKIFHEGTSNLQKPDPALWAENYLDHCTERASLIKQENIRGDLPLPPPDFSVLQDASLWDTLLKRKTCREFLSEKADLQTVSTLLYATLSPLHGEWKELGKHALSARRTSPSGGGLQSTAASLLALRVEGLSPGAYHYHPESHTLSCITPTLKEAALISALDHQEYAQGLAFGVLLSADFKKMWAKYPHSRSYRVALMDAGHLSQTLLLTGTALHFQTWLSGSFYDEEMNQWCKGSPLMFVGFGKGTNNTLPLRLRNLLD